MVRTETDYSSIPRPAPRSKKSKTALFALVSLCAISAVSFVVLSSSNDSVSFESLAKAAPKAVEYGDYISLKNSYNEYLLVSHSGNAYTGGYHQDYDRIQILSGNGAQGPVNFGDSIALVGQNDMFCGVQNDGTFNCHAQHLHKRGLFTLQGGTGPLKADDIIHLESMFGFVTARNTGVTGLTETLTSMEKYKVELPGQETGLAEDMPLTYGMSIFLRNANNAFLQVNGENGWISVGAAHGNLDQFEVLSPQHRKGPVRYGDKVILRAHNDNMIQVRDGKLTAYTKGRHAHTVFEFIGSTGVITNHRMFALKSAYGFVNTQTVGRQADVDKSGHYDATKNWELVFAFRH